MLKTGYTSVERVIENVIRDTGFTSEINWVDIIEWIYIASELIGVKNAYVLKITDGNSDLSHPDPIVVTDYRGELPTDFHMIYQVRDYDTKESLRASTYSYLISTNSTDFNNSSSKSYTLNEDYIFTSFEEGNLEIAYYAFPTDANGLPLIPDDVMYIRAIEAYLTERIARKLWLQDKMSTDKYKALEQDWLFYVNSARTKDALMTIDQAESFKNQYVRIATNFNEHATQFGNLGQSKSQIVGDQLYSWNQIIKDEDGNPL